MGVYFSLFIKVNNFGTNSCKLDNSDYYYYDKINKEIDFDKMNY